jgi:tetratricopeptide (TPR) repeat protein
MTKPDLHGEASRNVGPRNVGLSAYLDRLGWSPENLAHHLNGLARSMRLPHKVHPKTPRRWVQAVLPHSQPCVPRHPWPGLVCTVLSQRLHEQVTLASLGWQMCTGPLCVPTDDGLNHPWNPDGVIASLREVVEAAEMDRRHFVVMTGAALTAFVDDWLVDPERVAASIQGKRVDDTVVDDLERVAAAQRRLNDALGGGTVFRAVREELRLVTGMLDNANYTEKIGRRLYAVAAEFARLAGWLAFDSNYGALAQRYFMAGLRAAHSSGDHALGANILSFMSIQARYHDPRDAVRMAESALARASDLTPALAASLNGRLTISAACVGDARTADRARGRMFDLLGEVDFSIEPPWIYWWSEAEAHYSAGQSAQALNDPREAEKHYRNALARLDHSFVRDRASWLIRLAIARVQLGELDGACRAATEAGGLVQRLNSPYICTRLAEFRKAVQPHATTALVKDFDARFGELSTM